MNIVEQSMRHLDPGMLRAHIRMPTVLDESYHVLKDEVLSAEFAVLDALDFNIDPPCAYEQLLL